MKKYFFLIFLIPAVLTSLALINRPVNFNINYSEFYFEKLNGFAEELNSLQAYIEKSKLNSRNNIDSVKRRIHHARKMLKPADFWLRYLEPVSYKKINGPLPVEWEFELNERPKKTTGAGLTLAEIYVDENYSDNKLTINKDTLLNIIQPSLKAVRVYSSRVIADELLRPDHFFFCNRLFLLNLAAIYTTGFECPDTTQIIPELKLMLENAADIYSSFDRSFPEYKLTDEYLTLYNSAVNFVSSQSNDFSMFDHFTFIKNYINPLFGINQHLIKKYKVVKRSYLDQTLNDSSSSIFSKDLFRLQNSKGVFREVTDDSVLAEIDHAGKLLFYDPILSGNNQRSCVSCHKSFEYFTDTSVSAALQFNRHDPLTRNTPSLINVVYNKLLMLDGKHVTQQMQAQDVITNPIELNSDKKELLEKIMSCPDYNKAFTGLIKFSPEQQEVTFDHIVSAITFYYSKFSNYYSPFDNAMNDNSYSDLNENAKKGFNLFMGKAKCGTCHFVPHFNGVKPPYVSSEFEIIGVPSDTGFTGLSGDSGRYSLNRVLETLNAFRTVSVRNAEFTKPYMHNGVFSTLNQVMDFYNAGGGAGRNLNIPNQTLSADSLRLTEEEKNDLILFIRSLSEDIVFESPPDKLPESEIEELNLRKVGGEY